MCNERRADRVGYGGRRAGEHVAAGGTSTVAAVQPGNRFMSTILRTYPQMLEAHLDWRNEHTLVQIVPIWHIPLTNELIYTHCTHLFLEYPAIRRISVQLGLVLEDEPDGMGRESYFFYPSFNTNLFDVYSDAMRTRASLKRIILRIDLADKIERVHMACRGNSGGVVITNCILALHACV